MQDPHFPVIGVKYA